MVFTPEVTEAFNEVRKFHPEVTQVTFDKYGLWLFTDKYGNAPDFGGKVNVSILEDAVDSLDQLPITLGFIEVKP